MTRNSFHDELLQFWEERWRSGETPWDHGQNAPPFEEFVEKIGAPAGKILIPGPGSGHDVRYFARHGAKVTGMDIAPAAIEVARKTNAHSNAEYHLGNILDPDPKWHHCFDWVIEHTCLCAINPRHWEEYAQGVLRLLKPSGYYLALFYRDPHDDGGPPFRIEEETIDALFGKDFDLLKAWVPKRAYESRAGREELRWYKLKPGER